jgi:hypothetical protein
MLTYSGILVSFLVQCVCPASLPESRVSPNTDHYDNGLNSENVHKDMIPNTDNNENDHTTDISDDNSTQLYADLALTTVVQRDDATTQGNNVTYDKAGYVQNISSIASIVNVSSAVGDISIGVTDLNEDYSQKAATTSSVDVTFVSAHFDDVTTPSNDDTVGNTLGPNVTMTVHDVTDASVDATDYSNYANNGVTIGFSKDSFQDQTIEPKSSINSDSSPNETSSQGSLSTHSLAKTERPVTVITEFFLDTQTHGKIGKPFRIS